MKKKLFQILKACIFGFFSCAKIWNENVLLHKSQKKKMRDTQGKKRVRERDKWEIYVIFAGNAFLVNVALADLMVTGLVLPASAIVILAGHKESLGICRFEWTLEALCFLVTVLTLAAIAVENYMRLYLPVERWVHHNYFL